MKEIIFRAATIEDIPQLVDLRFMAILETSGVDPDQSTPEFEFTGFNKFIFLDSFLPADLRSFLQ